MLFNMPVAGINQGIQPIIGYNYGAKNFKRVKRTLQLATIGATILCIFGFIATFFFNRNIISLFTKNDPAIMKLGALGIKYALITLPLVGFQFIGSAYFQAVGKFKQALLLNIAKQVVIIIPLLLILPLFFGLYGGIAAFPATDIISSVLTAILISAEWKNLDEKHARQENELVQQKAGVPAGSS
jgi:Na+-driven multidrug efflux pump